MRNASAPAIAPPITVPETFEEEPDFDRVGVWLAVALTDGLDVTEGWVDESSTFNAPKYSY